MLNPNLNQHSLLTAVHVCVCVYHCAQLWYTTQHSSHNFLIVVQMIITAQMVSTGGDGQLDYSRTLTIWLPFKASIVPDTRYTETVV